MIETRYFVEPEYLPDGFAYPQAYMSYAASGVVEDLKPWRFLWLDEPEFIYQGLRARYPNRIAVPFARRTDSDDLACFEMSDGGVAISIIHDFAEPGWEHRGTLLSFERWLSLARSDAAERLAEEDED